MDERLFRDAMGKFATGITIVTIDNNDEVKGMTVNAFMSVSLNPKLIAISIDEKASMYNKLLEANKFGVSVLTQEQKEIAMVFAKQMEKNQEIKFTVQDGVPVIADSIAAMTCEVQETAKAGDHMIFIAEVTEVQLNGGDPLLYYGSQYRNLEEI